MRINAIIIGGAGRVNTLVDDNGRVRHVGGTWRENAIVAIRLGLTLVNETSPKFELIKKIAGIKN
jgi:hypothetical protein